MRKNGRKNHELRPVRITKHFIAYPEGSVLIEFGNTKVICNATIEDRVPGFLKGTGQGWITAEYSMLPRSTHSRMTRESVQGKLSGRTQEIQRLIGRSLRAAVDMNLMGEKTIWIDCDVIQADGGTRTASITGAYVALCLAVTKGIRLGHFARNPVRTQIAAVSLGIASDRVLLDLDYEEDSSCDIDFNLVMDSSGNMVEIQGTGERGTFSRTQLDRIMDTGWKGIRQLFAIQKQAAGK